MMSSLNKDLVVLLLGRGLQVLALFLNYKLLVHFLGEAQVGAYFVILSISAYFGLVLINPIGVYLNRQLHTWRSDHQLLSHLLVFTGYSVLVSLLSIPLCYILSSWIDFGNLSPLMMGALIGAYVLALTLCNSFVPALNILNHRVPFVVFTVLTQFMGLGLSIYFVSNVSADAVHWLLGQALAHFVFAIVAYFWFVRLFSGELGVDEKKTGVMDGLKLVVRELNYKVIYRFAWPLILTNVFLWLITQSYRLVMEHFGGLEFLGVAGFGLSLASTLVVTVEYLLQQLFLPKFYESIGKDSDVNLREAAWNRYASQTLPVFLSLGVFISVLAPFLVSILGSQSYKAAVYFLAIGVWAEMLRGIGNVFSLIGQSEMNTRKTIKPYMYGGVITSALLLASGYLKIYHWSLPMVLIVGHLVVLVGLVRTFGADFRLEIGWRRMAQTTLPSVVFMAGVPLYRYSDSMAGSVLIVGFFGMLFAYFQYCNILRGETQNG